MGLNIFICSPNISNYYQNLSIGFEKLALKPIEYFMREDNYTRETDRSPLLLKTGDHLYRFITMLHPRLTKLAYACQQLFRMLWLICSLVNFDRYIFGFGQTLLFKNVDLLILRLFRKKVIVVMAHGSESRPPYLDGAYCAEREFDKEEISALRKRTTEIYNHVSRVQRFNKIVIGHPNNFQFARKAFVNMEYIGQPTVIPNFSSLSPASDSKAFSLKILHAPSDYFGKGTLQIRKVVEKLNQNYDFQYTELCKVSHSVLMRTLKDTNLVIDQFYSDAPTSGFCLEASSLGIPTVISGYYEKRTKDDGKMYPPVIQSSPDELEGLIESHIEKSEQLRLIGMNSLEYVQDNLSPEQVALKYQRVLEGDIPKEWWTKPQDLNYVYGYGQSKLRIREILSLLIEIHGIQSLKLSHNPKLLQKIQDEIIK